MKLVIGPCLKEGNDEMEFSFETLSLVDQKSWLFARLLEIGRVPI